MKEGKGSKTLVGRWCGEVQSVNSMYVVWLKWWISNRDFGLTQRDLGFERSPAHL